MGNLARERIPKQKTIMRHFKLEEISAVDNPAQVDALAAIAKRDDSAKFYKAAPSIRSAPERRHADDPNLVKILKLDGVAAMTYAESQFAGRLKGDRRRHFVLADHAGRQLQMAADGGDDKDKPTKKDTEPMTKFTTLEQAAAHYAKSGMSDALAKRTAASAHPELRYVSPADALAKSDEGQALAKSREGAVRRNVIADKVNKIATERKIPVTRAFSVLREQEPELFETEAA